MKILKIAAAAASVVLLLTACSSSKDNKNSTFDFTMPDSPVEAVLTTVPDSTDEDQSYAAMEFDGKTYVAYGTANGELEESDVGPRLGYVKEGEVTVETIGLFPLTADPDQNYLLCMDEEGVMENRTIFRNSETVGKDISTPSFIVSKDYNYWK